jgi:hypothetical protein
MALFRGMYRPDHQYPTVSVRDVKYTHLWYMTRLSKLHILDLIFSISFSEEQSFGNTRLRARK